MAIDIEFSLRNQDSYKLARAALEAMESQAIWPTPLNYELWLHYVGDPSGALGSAMRKLLGSGEVITEALAENLATTYLTKARLTEEIRDAGSKLTEQLETITAAIQTAQRSSNTYGQTLAGATVELAQATTPPEIAKLVAGLANATQTIQRANASLEKRLSTSTQEVGRLRENLEQVRREAMTDALTALANRKALDECLEHVCDQAEKNGARTTMAVVDIDHFKRFNDTWGHQTGDQVIRYVASVMARVGRPPRLAARYGGEEFALIFPGEDMAAIAMELDHVRREIGSRTLKRRSTNEDLGAVTVSIGLAEYHKGEGVAGFLERADAALYTSKRTGRDRVTCADTPRSEAA